uniref:gametogenetin-binding protein 2 n=1 Tax=Ciona intestinalis TaxID=7719 RepID=UPI000180BC93|nr:gametogenetin-binding protein 2 [Ciona intestinalis]|eukprot:XP_026690872.1 gametogenetin-binding protein 2 [Ciona intestinalis]
MSQVETFGFDKARLVGVYNKDECDVLAPMQLPLYVDETLMMVVQFEDQVSKKWSAVHSSKREYNEFLRKYNSLDVTQLNESCGINERDLFVSLPQLVSCVGCRRAVENLFQQVQKSDNSVYESIRVTSSGWLDISPSFKNNPKKLYHLFHCVRPKLKLFLESLRKKNKRCLFHSLKLQKSTDFSIENKPNLPKWCNCSVIDVWDQMCQECREEITMIDCAGFIETMNQYLKKHRFCTECKAKVHRAFQILTGEVDYRKEPGFSSAIYQGLKTCNATTTSDDSSTESKHIHVCCDRSYIVHMLMQANAEMEGGRKERHAKTTDIAQEEVCTCIALYLHQRLHRLWHQKLTHEQTWLTLFYLGIEACWQNFEMAVQDKIGIGRMEALCEELEMEEKVKESKLEKKRMKRKRQKKKKENKPSDCVAVSEEVCRVEHGNVVKKCAEHGSGESLATFHSCLLDMLEDDESCECSQNGTSDNESPPELTQEEIEEFERNRTEIEAERFRLRERFRQDFQKFVGAANNEQ